MAYDYDFPFTIQDVVALLRLTVRRSGPGFLYVDCPLCGDRRKKTKIDLTKNCWHCYYCGEGGGMLALYAKVCHVSNSDAYREIIDALVSDEMPQMKLAEGAEAVTQAAPAPQAQQATPQEIHQTLSMLLSMLTLTPIHRKHLNTVRGLTDEQIKAFGFKSTPPGYLCVSLTSRLIKAGCKVKGVPGFYVNDKGAWTVKFYSRTSGIIIPIQGADGLIRGLQVRLDRPIKNEDDPPEKTGIKYLTLSSAGKNMGTGPSGLIHFVGDPGARVVYVTEGALKSDVAHALTGRTFVGTIGANNTGPLDALFAFLKRNGTQEIIEAEDMDKYRILFYQKQLRAEALERKDKKTLDTWDRLLAPIQNVPKDWVRWVDKTAIEENYIFYDYRKGGAKEGYCTHCERSVPLQVKPRHLMEGVCPRCHRKIVYRSTGRSGRFFTEERAAYLIQKYPGGLVVREFWVYRAYQHGGHLSPVINISERARDIYSNGKYYPFYWGLFKFRTTRWVEGAPCRSCYGYGNAYYWKGGNAGHIYGMTLPSLAVGNAKKTGLVEWIRANDYYGSPAVYMNALRKVPQLEQMVKAGLTELANECYAHPSNFTDLIKNPGESKLTRALGINTQELKRLRALHGGSWMLTWLQWENESGKPFPDEVVAWYEENKLEPRKFQFIWDRMNPLQVKNYLERQAKENRESVENVIITWKDYLSMAEKLGIDTSDEIVYRVHRLHLRHNELVARLQEGDSEKQAIEVLKEFPALDQICRSIREKYSYANEEYMIVVPGGVKDIIQEGLALHHCVGNSRYWDRISTHESYILFLRKTEAPNAPYYTLEVEPDGTVRQKRTNYDRQRPDIEDAMKFLAEWQAVLKKRLTQEDKAAAKASRVLREQEFQEMRENNVIIHTGDLAGQRLVDVLTADLMENAA